MIENIAGSNYDLSNQECVKNTIKPEYLKGSEDKTKYLLETYPFDNFNYKIIVEHYQRDPHIIGTTKIIVRDINTDKEIISICRNYTSAPLLLTHYKNKDYLFTGTNYQGISVINITDKSVSTFIPKNAEKGWGFCIADFISFDPDSCKLYVTGCYWGGPYENRIYKIDPDNIYLGTEDDNLIYAHPDYDDEDEDE